MKSITIPEVDYITRDLSNVINEIMKSDDIVEETKETAVCASIFEVLNAFVVNSQSQDRFTKIKVFLVSVALGASWMLGLWFFVLRFILTPNRYAEFSLLVVGALAVVIMTVLVVMTMLHVKYKLHRKKLIGDTITYIVIVKILTDNVILDIIDKYTTESNQRRFKSLVCSANTVINDSIKELKNTYNIHISDDRKTINIL